MSERPLATSGETNKGKPSRPNSVRPWCVLWQSQRCPNTDWRVGQDQYSETKTFMNVPYAEDYAELEIALWVTLKLHRLTPVFAREREQESRNRLCRISHLMWQCRYGVSDYTHARLNVAFEDAIMRRSGIQVIAMCSRQGEFVENISDLRALEPVQHRSSPIELISNLSQRVANEWHRPPRARRNIVEQTYESLLETYKTRYMYNELDLLYKDAAPVIEASFASQS